MSLSLSLSLCKIHANNVLWSIKGNIFQVKFHDTNVFLRNNKHNKISGIWHKRSRSFKFQVPSFKFQISADTVCNYF